MAIINSVVVGRGKKSVGEVTLAYQRGRTIARRRVFENKSRTSLQTVQRDKFKTIVKLTSPYKSFFAAGFERSQYGSSFNSFISKIKERWLSEEFKKVIEKGIFTSVYDDTASPFIGVLDSLTNAVTVEHKAEYGDGLPYVGYGSITPVSYVAAEAANKQNAADSVSVVTDLGDGKGWAVDLVGFVGTPVDLTFENSKTSFISRTLNLYQNGELPNLILEGGATVTVPDLRVTTDTEAGTVTFYINAKSAIVALYGGGENVPQEGVTGIVNFAIRKYQKYIKNTMYLLANVNKNV